MSQKESPYATQAQLEQLVGHVDRIIAQLDEGAEKIGGLRENANHAKAAIRDLRKHVTDGNGQPSILVRLGNVEFKLAEALKAMQEKIEPQSKTWLGSDPVRVALIMSIGSIFITAVTILFGASK